MKKILFFALAALLVVAFTLPAAAKTTFTASGLAKSRAFYLSNPGAMDEDLYARKAFLDQFYAIHFRFSPGGPAAFVATFEGLQKLWGGALGSTEPMSFDTDYDMGQDASLRNDARWTEAMITYYALRKVRLAAVCKNPKRTRSVVMMTSITATVSTGRTPGASSRPSSSMRRPWNLTPHLAP
ncbi:MAG: hypothetical protein JRI85_06265 [Deltaproteobacteria bacterium]|nr:hypothetical protein [Deltaproteobacteria bacterium]